MSPEKINTANGKAPRDFATTNWTNIIQAARTHSPEQLMALQKLCTAYWFPIYAFVRRKGHNQHDAEDLTQGFFTHIVARESLRKADQAKGRFRNFLLASLTNFLANDWDKRDAQKRGGAKNIILFSDCSPEELYSREPATHLSPEQLFERKWAAVLMERVLDKLRSEYESSGKGKLFAAIHPFLTQEAGASALAEPASRLGTDDAALKVAVHRMRRRFGVLLREEIARTVSCPDEVEQEIRNLMSAIAV